MRACVRGHSVKIVNVITARNLLGYIWKASGRMELH